MAHPTLLPRPKRSPDAVARGLGWFSIGLGLYEVLMPDRIARRLGMRGREGLVRAYGVREIVQGVGILAGSRRRAPWVWARVAGDALDIGTLVPHLDRRNRKRANVAVALAAVAGVTAVDIATARELSEKERQRAQPVRDYSDRSGFPRRPEEMRGIARGDAVQRIPRKPEPAQPRLSS